MSSEYFNLILNNLLENVEEIKAAAIVLRNGLIVSSILRDYNGEDDILGAITAVFDKFLKVIKNKLGSSDNVINIVQIDHLKLTFVGAGQYTILTIISAPEADDKKLKVYGTFVAKKIALSIEEKEIDHKIPKFLEILANLKQESVPSGNYFMKILLVGDPNVGKRSLVNITNNFFEFSSQNIPDINLAIENKTVKLTEDSIIEQSIWIIRNFLDKQDAIRQAFYKGADMIFLQFDVDRKSTFDRIDFWVKDIQNNLNKSVPILLIANKWDVPQPKVTIEDIKLKAQEISAPFFTCSAINGTNVEDIFLYASYKYFENKFEI